MWVLSPGQRIDRYLVEALVGAGGVAVVYRVRHTHLDSIHALKLLVTDTPSVRRRMRREARVQFTLRHPNIVKVTDLLEVEGRPALIMEYVDGPTLREWMHQTRPALADALALFKVAVRAVGFAHAHGHVHRDLKPANVLLGRTPDGFVPKVTDFGIVKTLHGLSGGTTQQGVFMGTPEYTAPEQIRNAALVDHRADLFALGCILYEIACRQLPFVGHDVMSTLAAVRRGTYIEPKKLAPDVPPAVSRAIHGLLQPEPERRIRSCDELLAILGASEVDPPEPPNETPEQELYEPVSAPDRAAGTWPSMGHSEGRGAHGRPSEPPAGLGDVAPTRVVEVTDAPWHAFDEGSLLGARALAHRLALDLLAVQRGSHDPAALVAHYASAREGTETLLRLIAPLDLADAEQVARGLMTLVEAGQRDGRPLEPSTVDTLLRGMDALLLRLKAHADGRPVPRAVARDLGRVARVLADLGRL